MSDALGTPGGVVSDEDHRLAIAGLVAKSTTIAGRTGVLTGPGCTAIITGTSATGTMTVNVAPHHWVTSRAAGDGVYVGAKEATSTVNIAAAPGSNSRIDVVYAKQNDSGSTISPDGSVGEFYGVVTGTAAASPVEPALPVGAVKLGTVTVAAGATNTLGAGVTIINKPILTVANGADVPVWSQAERDALTTYPFLKVKRMDTGDIEARNVTNTAWVTIYSPTPAAAPSWTSISPAANFASYVGAGSSVMAGTYDAFGWRIDGNRVWLRGWINTTGAVAALATAGTLPVSARPARGRTLFVPSQPGASTATTMTRWEVFTNGGIYTQAAIATNQYFNFDQCSYYL